MSTERRPGFPNEEPEGKKTLEEWIEWIQREQKREYRPIRLHVTRFEKLRVAAQTNEPLRTTIAFAMTLTDPEAAKKPLIANELEEEARKINEARKQQLTPITPEEFEAQDVKGAINLMRAERTMSGKINLVEKLQP